MFSRGQKARKFSKNCWKPKLTDGFGCIICNQQKDCASVETSLATVHARAQEMESTNVKAASFKRQENGARTMYVYLFPRWLQLRTKFCHVAKLFLRLFPLNVQFEAWNILLKAYISHSGYVRSRPVLTHRTFCVQWPTERLYLLYLFYTTSQHRFSKTSDSYGQYGKKHIARLKFQSRDKFCQEHHGHKFATAKRIFPLI